MAFYFVFLAGDAGTPSRQPVQPLSVGCDADRRCSGVGRRNMTMDLSEAEAVK